METGGLKEANHQGKNQRAAKTEGECPVVNLTLSLVSGLQKTQQKPDGNGSRDGSQYKQNRSQGRSPAAEANGNRGRKCRRIERQK